MAVKSEKQINAFIRGLITEASPLTFPPDASLDEDNFILNRDGSRYRRLGMEYESGYALNNLGTTTTSPTSFHEWKLSGGDSDISIGVVRVHNKLWFINMLDQSPSSALLNSSAAIEISLLGTSPISTAVINNALIIVSKDIPYPLRLTYDENTDTVTSTEYKVYVRDFWGVYDGLIDNERPTVLSLAHKYNLLNQGWAPTVQTECVSPNDKEPIECTFVKIAKYPSNSDLWSIGLDADSSTATFEKYVPSIMVRNTHDFLHAPKGKHILDVFNRGASRTEVTTIGNTGATGDLLRTWPTVSPLLYLNVANPTSTTAVPTESLLPFDKEAGSFTTVASYAGRVWYSGVRTAVDTPDAKSPNYSGYVFFSQAVTNDDKIGKCYQEADPTSKDVSDIIDTDGGAVHIIDAINIIAVVPTKSMLLVFAENGVWQISGGEANFSATDYDVSKVSAIGCNSINSIVAVNNEVYYFAKAGIFRIVSGQDGELKSENMTLTSIQTLYNSISDTAKQAAKGVFEEKENTIRWLYNDSINYQGETSFNRELVLDLTIGSFYPNTIDNSAVHIADFVKIPDYAESQNTSDVLVGTDQVLVADLSEVVVDITDQVERDSPFSYLVIDPVNYKFTIAKYRDTTFKDWTIATGGTDYTSYLVTGYDIFGELMRKKQVPYIMFYFDRTEDGFSGSGVNITLDNPSSCLVQAQWNWSNSANSGKWGTPFQAYRLLRNYIPSGVDDTFDYGDRVIVTKNKLRGSGRSLSLKISSESGKDMKLLGWAMDVTGRQTN
jgi:hypothetical protein